MDDVNRKHLDNYKRNAFVEIMLGLNVHEDYQHLHSLHTRRA
jgi:hypothetical protein